MKAVILAGGLGTRLRPLTETVPKVLVPIVNRPFIFHQMEWLKRQGVTDIILSLFYLSEKVEEVLQKVVGELNISFQVSHETKPLGTGGAVRKALSLLDDQPFLVLNGDILTDLDLRPLEELFHGGLALTLVEVEDPTRYGVVRFDDQFNVVEFVEKPPADKITSRWINAGIYILSPALFHDVPEDQPFSFERDLFPRWLREGISFRACPLEGYWRDIGKPQSYLEAHWDILDGEFETAIHGDLRRPSVWVQGNVSVDPTARLVGPLILGDRCSVGPEATVGPRTVIGDHVIVESHARVTGSVVWAHSRIGDSSVVEDAILGNHCRIESGAHVESGSVFADRSIVAGGVSR